VNARKAGMRGTLAVLLACCTLLCGCFKHTVTVEVKSLDKVLQESGLVGQKFDPQDPLLRRRAVFVEGHLSLPSAHTLCQQLVYLDGLSAAEPIKLLINSGGGDCTAYMSIRAVMRGIEAPVETVNVGVCGSAAALLFQSATGKRYAVEGSTFMLHEPRGEPAELVKTVREHQEELLRSRCRLPEGWLPLGRRIFTFSAEEALEYEFVDAVLPKVVL